MDQDALVRAVCGGGSACRPGSVLAKIDTAAVAADCVWRRSVAAPDGMRRKDAGA